MRTTRDIMKRRDKGVSVLTFAEMLFPDGSITFKVKKERKSHLVECLECGRKVHKDRIRKSNLLDVCTDCGEVCY